MPKLDDLLVQVREATGPDSAIDFEIARLFDLAPEGYKPLSGVFTKYVAAIDSVQFWTEPALTSSIDAMLELIEAELPNCWVGMRSPQVEPGGRAFKNEYLAHASICQKYGVRTTIGFSFSPTIALALCGALLAACIEAGSISFPKQRGRQ